MFRLRHTIVVASVPGLCLSFLAACTKPSQVPGVQAAASMPVRVAEEHASALAPPPAAPAGRQLVLAITGEPEQDFNPVNGWGRYGSPLFQSTLLKHTENLDLVGDLATKWALSPDRKVWTVVIRDGVKFADGKPLTAQDVAFTYETAKQAADLLDLDDLESARALDPLTVEIRLKQPRITFVYSMVTLGILPMHAYKPGYGNNPLGSGPFRFVRWTRGAQLVMEPNPYYYGNKPRFERITLLYTTEDASIPGFMASQPIDIVAVTPAMATQVPPGMQRLAVRTVDNRGIMFPMQPAGTVAANGKSIGNSVTSDVAIRKAINIAINRQQLVDKVLGGYGTPAWSLTDGLPWDNAYQRLPDNDLAAAKALLDKAGWVENGGRRSRRGVEARFTLHYLATDTVRRNLAYAVADMVKPLGITIDLSARLWPEIIPDMHNSAVLFGWGSHDPMELYNMANPRRAGVQYYNAGYYDNLAVTRHLEAAQSDTSPREAIQHWREAAWDGRTGFGMKGDAAWAWLVNVDHLYFVNKCLDIGPRQIEPHGHGYPITWNIQDWKWTCP